jgi:hypothetical protein
MKVHIEAPTGVGFFPKPPNFGVEAHIEAPTGVSLSSEFRRNEKLKRGPLRLNSVCFETNRQHGMTHIRWRTTFFLTNGHKIVSISLIQGRNTTG